MRIKAHLVAPPAPSPFIPIRRRKFPYPSSLARTEYETTPIFP